MSGFVAEVRRGGAPADASVLERMLDAMAYCGPDGQTVRVEGSGGLGHVLLGPEPGGGERQPLGDGRGWIVSDARIDGRDRPGGDAAAILGAYALRGERCVEGLIGDFAFAVWEEGERRLFCARDHFGVVPLYYAETPDGLVVGNVLRALLAHPAVSGDLYEPAIADVLLFQCNMDLARTAFASIRAVPPAHVLTWEDGATRVRRYWSPPDGAEVDGRARPEEHVERFRAAFDAAVGDRLLTDRAGTHVSGGMDSTSVAATAAAILRERGGAADLRGYVVVSRGLFVEEEGEFADLVAAHAGIPLERIVEDDHVEPLGSPRDGGWVLPEPGLASDRAGTRELARRVAGFSRTLLTGIGGDPLLSPPAPPGGAGWRARARQGQMSMAYGRLPRVGLRTAVQRRLRSAAPQAPPLPDWLDAELVRRCDLETRRREMATRWDVPPPWQLSHPLWPAIFAASHPGAHRMPFRAVHPFFDLRVAEASWRMPVVPWRQDKLALREAMRGRLPDAVRRRPKTPLYRDGRRPATENPAYRLAVLPEARRARTELLAGDELRRYVDVARAQQLVDDPPTALALNRFEPALGLAHWLRWRPGR